MAATMTLAEFYNYLRDNRKQMSDIYREVEEVQFQFNNLHRKQLEEQAKLVDTYAQMMLENPDGLPESMAEVFGKHEQAERAAIQQQVTSLDQDIAEKRRQAEDLVKEAQRQLAYLREQNPILNQQEEELKGRQGSLRDEIELLDEQYTRLGRGLVGRIANMGRRRRIHEQRAQLVSNINDLTRGIDAVRLRWQTEKTKLQEKQANLRASWQGLTVDTAQLESRSELLTVTLDEQARQNAARKMLLEIKEVPAGAGVWQDRLAPLAELNRSRTNYEMGLRSVAELLGLLKGLGEGMDRFTKSVGTVYEEQRRYSLAPLEIRLSDTVTSFHGLWPELRAKVKDEKYLGAHPLEFSQNVQSFISGRLQDKAIQAMFEELGAALNRATRAWK